MPSGAVLISLYHIFFVRPFCGCLLLPYFRLDSDQGRDNSINIKRLFYETPIITRPQPRRACGD